MEEVLKVVVMGRACQKYCKHQEPSAYRHQMYVKAPEQDLAACFT